MSKLALEVERMCRELREKTKIAKNQTGKQKRRARRRTEGEVIAEVRPQVFEMDSACICGMCKPAKSDEMHEVISRQKTRGMAPEKRFNVLICVRLSRKCHHATTGEVGRGKSLTITFEDPERGAMGVVVGRYRNGRVFRYERMGPLAHQLRAQLFHTVHTPESKGASDPPAH